jgi:gamma-tubulin complex component 5
MAHVAVLNGLTQQLITSITGVKTGDRAFKSLRDQTAKGLREQSHARTNQFAVKSQLEGLAEKFEVLNRDDLARAFQSRIEELPTDQKWLPEILSLLLELSDRPAEKTVLDDVEHANAPPLSASTLDLDVIFAKESTDDVALWDDVERGYHSSDDDLEDDSDPTISTQATSVAEEDVTSTARLHLIEPDEQAIAAVKATRESWSPQASRNSGHVLSELTVVREILSSMHGLPTDLFDMDDSSGRVSLTRRARMATASNSTLHDVLNECMQTATIVNSVRRWVASHQNVACIQSIQAAVQTHLIAFDVQICQLEAAFISPASTAVVSAIGVQTDITRFAAVILRLAALIKRSTEAEYLSPFVLLDTLYDETNMAEMMEDVEIFQSLAVVFLAGLKTYLRHVAAWIKTGSLAAKNDGTFFVLDSDKNCDAGNLWHDRFVVRTQPDGKPYMPRCIFESADRLFALGKSRSFLRRLNQRGGESEDIHDLSSATPSFEPLLQALREGTFTPFSQLLSNTLDSWMSDVGTDCTPQLREQLFTTHGLGEMMTALPCVYFSKDGIAFGSFADSLIKRVSKSQQMTNADQFLLTELAQTTFGVLPGVDADNIYFTTATQPFSSESSVLCRLGACTISYNVSWPIQNIVRARSSTLHSTVFTLLLQVHYASQLMDARFFDMRASAATLPETTRLRQRLICFITLLLAFITTTAHTLHSETQLRLKSAEDIDAMVRVWADYEQRLQTSLLLSARLEPMREAIMNILEISELLVHATGPKNVAGLLERFDSGMSFLVAGVRGISRAGGEEALGMFAERLEWMVK